MGTPSLWLRQTSSASTTEGEGDERMVESVRTAVLRRQEIHRLSQVEAPLWLAEPEKGFSRVPRTLSLLAVLMKRRELSGNRDPSSVYVELHTRHLGEGVVELTHEADHALAAGYTGNRAIRTWRDRMRLLEQLGFIHIMSKLGRKLGYALLIHPSFAVAQIKDQGKVEDQWMLDWWTAYRARQIETGETSADRLVKAFPSGTSPVDGPAPKTGVSAGD